MTRVNKERIKLARHCEDLGGIWVGSFSRRRRSESEEQEGGFFGRRAGCLGRCRREEVEEVVVGGARGGGGGKAEAKENQQLLRRLGFPPRATRTSLMASVTPRNRSFAGEKNIHGMVITQQSEREQKILQAGEHRP